MAQSEVHRELPPHEHVRDLLDSRHRLTLKLLDACQTLRRTGQPTAVKSSVPVVTLTTQRRINEPVYNK